MLYQCVSVRTLVCDNYMLGRFLLFKSLKQKHNGNGSGNRKMPANKIVTAVTQTQMRNLMQCVCPPQHFTTEAILWVPTENFAEGARIGESLKRGAADGVWSGEGRHSPTAHPSVGVFAMPQIFFKF